jgi:hypothetical protein
MATQYNRQLGSMRGQIIRKVGKPKEADDALTWALPQYTTVERDALTPIKGTIIYNSSTNKLNFYNGSSWAVITSV